MSRVGLVKQLTCRSVERPQRARLLTCENDVLAVAALGENRGRTEIHIEEHAVLRAIQAIAFVHTTREEDVVGGGLEVPAERAALQVDGEYGIGRGRGR